MTSPMAGHQPLGMFETLQARKEGASETMADAFVPMPYTSEVERLKRDAKMKAARNIGGVWLGASGARPIRGLSYDSDPFKQFSFARPIDKNRWMRDKDFIKMGRTLQPFDGPLKEFKKPPKSRPGSRVSFAGA